MFPKAKSPYGESVKFALQTLHRVLPGSEWGRESAAGGRHPSTGMGLGSGGGVAELPPPQPSASCSVWELLQWFRAVF